MDLLFFVGLILGGAVAGFFAKHLPMSGITALVLSLLPPAGLGLAAVFC
jgi:hypothetical protein